MSAIAQGDCAVNATPIALINPNMVKAFGVMRKSVHSNPNLYEMASHRPTIPVVGAELWSSLHLSVNCSRVING
jgi:hypothetical protein